VRRTLSLGDDAQIVQALECRVDFTLDGIWTVTSQIVQEDDPSHSLTGSTTGHGRKHGLAEAKKIADQHVDELRKTWASENGAEW
jgi:hypothetical protein